MVSSHCCANTDRLFIKTKPLYWVYYAARFCANGSRWWWAGLGPRCAGWWRADVGVATVVSYTRSDVDSISPCCSTVFCFQLVRSIVQSLSYLSLFPLVLCLGRGPDTNRISRVECSQGFGVLVAVALNSLMLLFYACWIWLREFGR